jgi:hypothetical protein
VRVILDTCVVSELQRANCKPSVRTRVEGLAAEELFLSVVSLGEIAKGVALLDPGRKKAGLDSWLLELHHEYSGRILSIDHEVAHEWGTLTALAEKSGRIVRIADGLIAATALRHGMSVMTRNVKDFEATGARLINPWEDE